MKITIRFLLLICAFFAVTIQINAQTGDAKPVYRIIKTSDSGLALNRQRVITPDETKRETAATDKTSGQIRGDERRVFDLINEKRREQNLNPLVWSDDVAVIARLHSQNMANFKFFSHAGLDGTMVSDRADQNGMSKWRAIGENIAYNQGFQNPLDCAVEGWMKSAAHRQNLLDPRWQESAIGIAVTPDGTYYFTQVFLLRK